jgi:hypothetical protein
MTADLVSQVFHVQAAEVGSAAVCRGNTTQSWSRDQGLREAPVEVGIAARMARPLAAPVDTYEVRTELITRPTSPRSATSPATLVAVTRCWSSQSDSRPTTQRSPLHPAPGSKTDGPGSPSQPPVHAAPSDAIEFLVPYTLAWITSALDPR